MKTEAIVHSLRDLAMVEIVEHTDNNHSSQCLFCKQVIDKYIY